MHPTLAQPARTMRRVAGLAWPCRRPGLVVSQRMPDRVQASLHRIVARCCTVSQRSAIVLRLKVAPLSHDTNLCIVTLLPTSHTARRIADCLAVSWTSSGCFAAPGCPVSRHNGCPSQPQYNNCIVTRPLARLCAHAAARPLVRSTMSCPLSAVSWPLFWSYRRPCYALARPCHGPQATPRPASQPSLSRYNTVYRDSNG